MRSFFPLPAWQQNLQVKRSGQQLTLQNRRVLDVAGDADPQTGYDVRVDGSDACTGLGTPDGKKVAAIF